MVKWGLTPVRVMKYEKSAGAIIFYRGASGLRYLLLYRKANPPYKEAWDFSKGTIEKGEDEIEAVKREVKEETDLADLVFIPDFREVLKVFYRREGELILKIIVFYLARTKTKKIKLSFEHDDYAWLGYKEALEKLTYKNSKEILKKADQHLVTCNL